MNFTKEQFDSLYDAKIHFESSKKGFIRNCPRWLTDHVADVFEVATGEKVRRNWNCSTCVFNFISRVANLYLQDLEEYDRLEAEQESAKEVIEEQVPVVSNEPEDTVVETEPKKKGKRKKVEK